MKTLNEISPANNFDRNKFSVREGITELISKKELRQEALAWVKHLSKKKCFYCANEKENKEYLIGWIKTFFNLSESDLK